MLMIQDSVATVGDLVAEDTGRNQQLHFTQACPCKLYIFSHGLIFTRATKRHYNIHSTGDSIAGKPQMDQEQAVHISACHML